MDELYEPTSEFLKLVGDGLVPLIGSEFGNTNLRRLIDLTKSDDLADRDWATFNLSCSKLDSNEIRAALHRCLTDNDEVVQEEAMVGLAMRGDLSALPTLERWFEQGVLSRMMLEAAIEFAAPSLGELLKTVEGLAERDRLCDLWKEACQRCGAD